MAEKISNLTPLVGNNQPADLFEMSRQTSPGVFTTYKTSAAQLNAGSGNIRMVGTWDASTNTPPLVSSVGNPWEGYEVSAAGNTILDGIGAWEIGDVVLFDANSNTWVRPFTTKYSPPLRVLGIWDATTNLTTLPDGLPGGALVSGVSRGYWAGFGVAVAGNTDLDGTTDWNVGDFAVFNQFTNTWQKLLVTFVNGMSGNVTLTTADIPDSTGFRYTPDIPQGAITFGSSDNEHITSDVTNFYYDITQNTFSLGNANSYTGCSFIGSLATLSGTYINSQNIIDNSGNTNLVENTSYAVLNCCQGETLTTALLQNSTYIMDDLGENNTIVNAYYLYLANCQSNNLEDFQNCSLINVSNTTGTAATNLFLANCSSMNIGFGINRMWAIGSTDSALTGNTGGIIGGNNVTNQHVGSLVIADSNNISLVTNADNQLILSFANGVGVNCLPTVPFQVQGSIITGDITNSNLAPFAAIIGGYANTIDPTSGYSTINGGLNNQLIHSLRSKIDSSFTATIQDSDLSAISASDNCSITNGTNTYITSSVGCDISTATASNVAASTTSSITGSSYCTLNNAQVSSIAGAINSHIYGGNTVSIVNNSVSVFSDSTNYSITTTKDNEALFYFANGIGLMTEPKSGLDINTSFAIRPTLINTNAYMTVATDSIIISNYTGVSAPTVVLTADSTVIGRIITIKDGNGTAGAHPITVQGFAGQTFDGLPYLTISSNNGVFRVICDDTNWSVI